MITVLQTHSLSMAESVRLALLAERIDAVMLDQASPGTLGLAGSVRVAILDDADELRGRAPISDCALGLRGAASMCAVTRIPLPHAAASVSRGSAERPSGG